MKPSLKGSFLVGSLALGMAFTITSLSASEQQRWDKNHRPQIQNQAPRQTAVSGELTTRVADKITIKDKEGAFHSVKTTKETRVTVNSRPAKLDELQSGDQVLVTLGKDRTAMDIAATRPQSK